MLMTETKTEIRNLRDGDAFRGANEEFPEGWRFDDEWVWVAIADKPDIPVAAIIASPCHGVVLIHRVWVAKGNGKALLPLFRRFIDDCVLRGFRGYMSHIDPMKKGQLRLLRIATKAGAQAVVHGLLCFGGKFEDLTRW